MPAGITAKEHERSRSRSSLKAGLTWLGKSHNLTETLAWQRTYMSSVLFNTVQLKRVMRTFTKTSLSLVCLEQALSGTGERCAKAISFIPLLLRCVGHSLHYPPLQPRSRSASSFPAESLPLLPAVYAFPVICCPRQSARYQLNIILDTRQEKGAHYRHFELNA